MKFIRVEDVKYLEDYNLEILFNDKTKRVINLKNELYGTIFEPLKDINYFKSVKVNPDTDTVEWPNGADFAPEFLYENSKQIDN